MEEAIDLLDLADVEIYPHKVTAMFERPVRGVITRAVEAVGPTLERAAGFLPRGGRVILMKGPAADDEMDTAARDHGEDFRLTRNEAYQLGRTRHRRRLVVYERISPGKTPDAGSARPLPREVAGVRNPNYKTWLKILESRGVRKHGSHPGFRGRNRLQRSYGISPACARRC